MDISAASVKTPEPETEAQTRIQPAKQLLTTNGVLKRHHLNPPPSAAAAAVVTYKECLKNHAATMGGHAVDGCGEFMPAPSFDPTNPTSLKCAACGCHRNFHRLDTDALPPPPSSTHQIIEYKPHHRHHPPPPPPHHPPRGSPTKSNSASPPPISSSYMLLALSGGGGGGGGLSGVPPQESGRLINHSVSNPGGRKRFRTKFSQNQKEKMLQFAERVGWKMQRKDEDLISGFCAEIGVEKGVFKVWMHNNKSTFAKNNNINKLNHHHLLHHNNGNGVNFGNTATTVSSNFHNHQGNNNNGSSQVSGHEEEGVVGNGSSSSS